MTSFPQGVVVAEEVPLDACGGPGTEDGDAEAVGQRTAEPSIYAYP